jgi:DNA-binding transcriptional MerR regulator
MPDHSRAKTELPPIPAKRYFTIGEVSDLCAVKPHVLRYWEQEFTQLKPVKRRGNRRYYQHHEVLLIRRIRDLLYEQGFTINGARHRLESDIAAPAPAAAQHVWLMARDGDMRSLGLDAQARPGWTDRNAPNSVDIRQELEEIRRLLGHDS